jgi:hypothetical protein
MLIFSYGKHSRVSPLAHPDWILGCREMRRQIV